MVKTNIQTFTGEVEILSNLHVGSYLTANGDASNVLDVTGNVGASFFVGDGGLISNIATTLSDIVDQGNLVANVVQFNAPPAVYAGVGIVTASNVGIQNANPLNTLSIADKVVIDKDVSEPSTTMNVHGKVYASRFEGDGGLLSNIATTLEAIINQGNVSANVVKFSSATDYAGAGMVTDSNVGIQNTAPVFNLSVGSNVHIDDEGSNVLTVHGNVSASNLNLGVFTVSASHGLDQVCAESNVVARPVRFSNVITAVSAVSNIESAGTFISTDAERGIDVASNIDIGGRLKFDSNVFIDTLRVADVAANIVTYDRTTGELLDSSGTFMNKFAVISEQPPSDLFANATTVTNHGGYTLTTSNLATNSNTYNAFDGTANAWVSGDLAGGYIGGANVFHENNLTQLSNLHPTQRGDWLAIEFPYKTTLRHMKLTPLTATQFPASANVYATNNDITWSEIKYWKDVVPASDTAVQTITVNATDQFKKYALVATKAGGTGSSNVAIQDWQLFTESFSIDGGKVAMAQQAATGGETVMDQHGPHGRGEAKLKKYPEIVFGSDSTKLRGNDSTNTYTQENYTVTASSQNQNPLLYSRGLTDLQGFDYGDTRSLTKDMVTATTVTIPLAYGAKEAGSALSPTGQAYHWSDWGNDVLDGWGHWYIYNTATGAASHIQFGTLNGPNGTVYTERQNHHSKMFTIKHGWVVNSIFKLDVECEDPTFSFSIGMYGNLGSDNATFQEDAQHTTSSGGTLSYNFNGNSSTGASSKSLFTHFIPKQRSFNDAITLTGNNFTTNLNTNVDTNGGQHGIWSDSLQIGATMYFVKGAVGGIEKSRSDWVAHDISGVANPWKVFDGITSRSSWASKSGTYYDGTSPANSYTGTTHQLGTGTVYGEWLKVKLSHRIKVTKLILYADVINEAPKSYKIYGSVTGSSWTELKDVSNETPSISGNSHEITDTEGYRYIAIVVTQVNTDQVNVRIGEIKLYGYDIFEGGDTSVDTTFKSIMNTPQISGAQVYVDGSLGETFTNRVVGPTVSNTHTTYVSAEKYWELSGNVESNVTLEANTFLSGDAPHSVSMWFNSSNLEANASNSCIFSLGTEERLDHVSTAFSNNYQTVQKFTAGSRSTTNANFGHSCAINSDGTRMIVGAYFEDNGATNYGAVYIYTYSDGKWDDGTRIGIPYPSSNITTDKGFGRSVDINSAGTRIVVGAHYDDEGANDAGAAYVYSYIGGTWTLDTVSGVSTGRIQASDKAANDRFGNSVAMNGDGTRIIVGSMQDDDGGSSSGSAYIYTYSGGSWGTEKKLVASDDQADDQFGTSVAITSDGTKVVVGAPYEDTGGSAYGKVYTYIYNSGTGNWDESSQKLQATSFEGTGDKAFGISVNMNADGTKMIVGAHFEDTGTSGVSTNDSGSAYIYTYSGGSWGSEVHLRASDATAAIADGSDDEFGWRVRMNNDGTKVIVGAKYEDVGGTDSGAAYVFEYDGSNWNEVVKLKAHDGAADDDFGFSVAMSGDGKRVVVGAEEDDDTPGSASGSVYVYDRDTTHHLITDLKLQSNTWHNLTYAYQGEGGSKVTYLDGRKVAEDQAEDTFGDYPPFAMTGYSQGGYRASSSEEYSANYCAENAFDDDTNTSVDNNYWSTKAAAYSTNFGSDDHRFSGATTTIVEDTNYRGAWLQLEMPHRLKVDVVRWQPRATGGMPRDGVVAGSNDGVNWYIIYVFNDVPTASDVADPGFPITPNGSVSRIGYKYIRIVVTNGGGNQYLSAQNVKIYGHRENDLVRLPEPTKVLKYPHVQLLNGPAKRGYRVSVSSEYAPRNQREGWMAFNDSFSVPGGHWQNNESSNKYTPGTGVPTNDCAVFPPGGTTKGEWIKLELPFKLKVSSIFIVTAPGAEAVEKAILYGSNDDSNWDVVKPEFTTTLSTFGTKRSTTEPVTTSTYYKYLVLQVTKADATGGGSNGRSIQLQTLNYYGIQEDISIPIQIGGGNIDKVANFRVYDKFIGEDQALEIWDAQKDEFGRAKSSMTLHKGRLGIGTTEPEGRLAVADEPDPDVYGFQEFPPRGMGGYKTSFEGHGEFCVSASSEHGDAIFDGWYAFDKGYTSTGGEGVSTWISGYDPIAYNSSGVATGSFGVINGVNGEYLILESPYKIKMDHVLIYPRAHTTTTFSYSLPPKDGKIWGRNTIDEPWTEIVSYTNLSYGATRTDNLYGQIPTRVNINATQYYKYIAFQITATNTSYGGSVTYTNYTNLKELRYFGYREQLPPKQSVLHDGQLTLTKNLNVPRIGPALDADDTPRRDRLVVEYNTSTNPTFEGAVRDTSGRGNDGILHSSVSYDANAKSFGSFGGGGLETMATNNLLESNGKHSFSAWIRFDTSGSWYAVYGIGGNVTFSGNNSITVYIGASRFRLESRGGSYRDYGYTFKHGKWVHMAVVYDGTGGYDNFDIYMDTVKLGLGSASSNGTAAITLPTENQTVRFGSTAEASPGATSGSYLAGAMSSVKFYDTVLTAEEVKTLYNMGRCDEGHHVVNFSKTRVGIGLGDGEAPRGALDVRDKLIVGRGNIKGNAVGVGDLEVIGSISIGALGAGVLEPSVKFYDTSGGHARIYLVANDVLGFEVAGYTKGYLRPDSGVVWDNFTGQHRTFIKDVPFSQASNLEGLIVSSDQNKYIKMSGGIEAGSNAITTNESLPIVSLSNVVTDKKCFGVISASEDPEERRDAFGNFVSVTEKEKGDTRVYINSVGEGAIWVSNIGGSLESGDYITTSNVAGYGQKQDDDVLHNYTVAKITMDCDFEPATQPVQQILRSNVIQTYYLGNVHKVKTVPHAFVTTTVGADDAWSNVSVSPSDVTYAEWSNLEANTQNTYTLTYTQTSNVVYDTKYTLTTTANVTESDPWDSVFVDPPDVTYAEYSNLEANTQSSYSLTFTKTTTDEKTPAVWSNLESNTQSLYNMVYYQSVEEEVAATWPGAVAHTRVTDVIENELDEHGQIQWEDHPTETEKAYKIRYLDVSGAQTDSANAVHIAAFVGCTYHCG
jgi:hypothetical protein